MEKENEGESVDFSVYKQLTSYKKAAESPLIYKLMPIAMKRIGAIAKTHLQSFHKYNFRSIDDALNALQPVLCDLGITVTAQVENHRVEIETVGSKIISRAYLSLRLTFAAMDGSKVENVAAGEGWDRDNDKASNKAMAAAMKYAVFFGLCVPTDPQNSPLHDPDAAVNFEPPEPVVLVKARELIDQSTTKEGWEKLGQRITDSAAFNDGQKTELLMRLESRALFVQQQQQPTG